MQRGSWASKVASASRTSYTTLSSKDDSDNSSRPRYGERATSPSVKSPYPASLVAFARSHLSVVKDVERRLIRLIKEGSMNAPIKLPSMDRETRDQTLELCGHFFVSVAMHGADPNRFIKITKIPGSTIPDVLLSEVVEGRESSARYTSSSTSSGKHHVAVPLPRSRGPVNLPSSSRLEFESVRAKPAGEDLSPSRGDSSLSNDAESQAPEEQTSSPGRVELRRSSSESIKGSSLSGIGSGTQSSDCVSCKLQIDNETRYDTFGKCKHRGVCSLCSLRRRQLLKLDQCLRCKARMEKVFCIDSAKASYDALVALGKEVNKQYTWDEESRMYLPHSYVDTVNRLRDYRCRIGNCEVKLLSAKSFQSHLRSAHQKHLCDVCLRDKKIFIQEQTLYSRDQLDKHVRYGEPEKGISGHPLCKFCGVRYFSVDQLQKHLIDRHFECHLCREMSGIIDRYYHDYQDLEKHFRKDHYLCEESGCLDQKFIVFANSNDLRSHYAVKHPSSRVDLTSLTSARRGVPPPASSSLPGETHSAAAASPGGQSRAALPLMDRTARDAILGLLSHYRVSMSMKGTDPMRYIEVSRSHDSTIPRKLVSAVAMTQKKVHGGVAEVSYAEDLVEFGKQHVALVLDVEEALDELFRGFSFSGDRDRDRDSRDRERDRLDDDYGTNSIRLQPMDREERDFVLDWLTKYNVKTSMYGVDPNRFIEITKLPESRIPTPLLSAAVHGLAGNNSRDLDPSTLSGYSPHLVSFTMDHLPLVKEVEHVLYQVVNGQVSSSSSSGVSASGTMNSVSGRYGTDPAQPGSSRVEWADFPVFKQEQEKKAAVQAAAASYSEGASSTSSLRNSSSSTTSKPEPYVPRAKLAAAERERRLGLSSSSANESKSTSECRVKEERSAQPPVFRPRGWSPSATTASSSGPTNRESGVVASKSQIFSSPSRPQRTANGSEKYEPPFSRLNRTESGSEGRRMNDRAESGPRTRPDSREWEKPSSFGSRGIEDDVPSATALSTPFTHSSSSEFGGGRPLSAGRRDSRYGSSERPGSGRESYRDRERDNGKEKDLQLSGNGMEAREDTGNSKGRDGYSAALVQFGLENMDLIKSVERKIQTLISEGQSGSQVTLPSMRREERRAVLELSTHYRVRCAMHGTDPNRYLEITKTGDTIVPTILLSTAAMKEKRANAAAAAASGGPGPLSRRTPSSSGIVHTAMRGSKPPPGSTPVADTLEKSAISARERPPLFSSPSPSVPPAPTGLNDVVYTNHLIKFANDQPHLAREIERSLKELLEESSVSASLDLPVMDRGQREATCNLCSVYRLRTQLVGQENSRFARVTKTPDSRLPTPLLSSYIKTESSKDPPHDKPGQTSPHSNVVIPESNPFPRASDGLSKSPSKKALLLPNTINAQRSPSPSPAVIPSSSSPLGFTDSSDRIRSISPAHSARQPAARPIISSLSPAVSPARPLIASRSADSSPLGTNGKDDSGSSYPDSLVIYAQHNLPAIQDTEALLRQLTRQPTGSTLELPISDRIQQEQYAALCKCYGLDVKIVRRDRSVALSVSATSTSRNPAVPLYTMIARSWDETASSNDNVFFKQPGGLSPPRAAPAFDPADEPSALVDSLLPGFRMMGNSPIDFGSPYGSSDTAISTEPRRSSAAAISQETASSWATPGDVYQTSVVSHKATAGSSIWQSSGTNTGSVWGGAGRDGPRIPAEPVIRPTGHHALPTSAAAASATHGHRPRPTNPATVVIPVPNTVSNVGIVGTSAVVSGERHHHHLVGRARPLHGSPRSLHHASSVAAPLVSSHPSGSTAQHHHPHSHHHHSGHHQDDGRADDQDWDEIFADISNINDWAAGEES